MSPRPHTPSWLARANFHKPSHHWDLKDVVITQCAPANIPSALRRAKLCAEKLILSDVGMAALYETLEPRGPVDEELGTASPVPLADIRKIIEEYFQKDNVFKYYVANWTDAVKDDACHFPPDLPESAKEAGVVDGNIFLHQQYVDSLPRGEAWSALDERNIMLLAWHMMHELSHSIATVLAKHGLIKTHVTPRHCFGFEWKGERIATYEVIRISASGSSRTWGERGWYMEDKLGGHLCMIDEEKPLVLKRGDLELQDKHAWFEVEQETVKRFVFGEQINDVPLPLPLTKQHPHKYDETQMRTFKSRGSFHHEPPEERGRWLIKHGFIKAR